MRNTEGGLDCLLIEMQTARVLACADRPAATVSSNDIEQTIKLCGDLFHGELIESYARSLLIDSELTTEFAQEAQATTESTCQFFAAIPGWNGATIILIMEGSRSIGLGWVAIRRTRERLMQFQPSDTSMALASDLGDAWRHRHHTPLAGRIGAPAPAESEESHVLLRAKRRFNPDDAAKETEGPASEPESSVKFGARSQMHRPRKKARKRPLFPSLRTGDRGNQPE